METRSFLGCAVAFVVLAGTASALAQQTTGTPGSPSATTTIGGKQLPPVDPKFGGVIKEKATDSKPWWPHNYPAYIRSMCPTKI